MPGLAQALGGDVLTPSHGHEKRCLKRAVGTKLNLNPQGVHAGLGALPHGAGSCREASLKGATHAARPPMQHAPGVQLCMTGDRPCTHHLLLKLAFVGQNWD